MTHINLISDIKKIMDIFLRTIVFHKKRDEMNSELHLSEVRYSPLTTSLMIEFDRLDQVLSELELEDEETNPTNKRG